MRKGKLKERKIIKEGERKRIANRRVINTRNKEKVIKKEDGWKEE